MGYDPPFADIVDAIENVVGLDDLFSLGDLSEISADLIRQVVESGANFVRNVIVPHASAIDAKVAHSTKAGCASRAPFPRFGSHMWMAAGSLFPSRALKADSAFPIWFRWHFPKWFVPLAWPHR